MGYILYICVCRPADQVESMNHMNTHYRYTTAAAGANQPYQPSAYDRMTSSSTPPPATTSSLGSSQSRDHRSSLKSTNSDSRHQQHQLDDHQEIDEVFFFTFLQSKKIKFNMWCLHCGMHEHVCIVHHCVLLTCQVIISDQV